MAWTYLGSVTEWWRDVGRALILHTQSITIPHNPHNSTAHTSKVTVPKHTLVMLSISEDDLNQPQNGLKKKRERGI